MLLKNIIVYSGVSEGTFWSLEFDPIKQVKQDMFGMLKNLSWTFQLSVSKPCYRWISATAALV